MYKSFTLLREIHLLALAILGAHHMPPFLPTLDGDTIQNIFGYTVLISKFVQVCSVIRIHDSEGQILRGGVPLFSNFFTVGDFGKYLAV